MRILFKLLIFVTVSLAATVALGKGRNEVSGIFTDDQGGPVKGATVFISGSDRVIPIDEDGRSGVSLGAFQLSVKDECYRSKL